jgi:ABC-type transporter MlaC component
VWQIFDMEEEEVNRFIDYINNFDDHLKKEA